MRTPIAPGLLLAALMAALLGACTSDLSGDAEEQGQAGMGVPQQLPGETYPGTRGRLDVRVHLADNGCFLGRPTETGGAGRYLVVWPAGTELGESGDRLRLVDGSVVRHGTALSGTGLLMPVDRLAGGSDGYWGHVLGFCVPRAEEVLVLDAAAVGS